MKLADVGSGKWLWLLEKSIDTVERFLHVRENCGNGFACESIWLLVDVVRNKALLDQNNRLAKTNIVGSFDLA